MITTPTIEREALCLETVIRVTDGVLYLVVDEDETVLLPGDEAVVPAGVSYRHWDAGDVEARFTETLRVAA